MLWRHPWYPPGMKHTTHDLAYVESQLRSHVERIGPSATARLTQLPATSIRRFRKKPGTVMSATINALLRGLGYRLKLVGTAASHRAARAPGSRRAARPRRSAGK
jgi:hypothetical protein